MSYARFGADGSDVYVYHDVAGCLRCCGCALQAVEWVEDPEDPEAPAFGRVVEPRIQTEFRSPDALEAHLAEHAKAGHHVPSSVMPNIREDWGSLA